MNAFAAEFELAAGMLDEQFGDTVTYHRGTQALTLTGVVKGFAALVAQEMTREPAQANLHQVDWLVPLAQLDSLADGSDSSPDWISDEAGDCYVVMPVEGDQDWEYTSPDKSRVRIRTLPDACPDADPPTTTTPEA